MPLKNSYVVWNNKGGVGKTTLTFHLSTEYALNHEDETIVVLDMCPKANASIALLSNLNASGEGQQGDQVLMQMASYKVHCRDADGSLFSYDQTVCGYLMAKIDKADIKCNDFLVKPSNPNEHLPGNMFLLCGDNYLDVIAKRLEGERSKGGPWKKVTKFMKTFVDGVVSAGHPNRTYTFFIDTNPSFAVYTELAVLAGNRLIVPFTADDFSRTAVKSMLYLLYGIEIDNERQVKYEQLQEYEFWYRAKQEDIILPQIHLLINNRITLYGEEVANAFKAKEEEIFDHIKKVINEEPSLFVNPNESKTMRHLNDFHTVAVQCLHLGCPLRNLPAWVAMAKWKNGNVAKNKRVYIENLWGIVKLL